MAEGVPRPPMITQDCVVRAPGDRRARPSSASNKTLKILLIEDDPADAFLARARLATCSGGKAQIVEVGSLEAAGISLTDDSFDAVLLDLGLPDGNGLDSVIMVLQQALTTPVVILTGDHDEAVATDALGLGVQDCVRKSDLAEENLWRILCHAVDRHVLRLSLERRINELETKRQNFRSLIADNADAIIVVDSQGVIRFANGAAERLLKRPSSMLLDSPFGIPIEGGKASEVELHTGDGQRVVADMRVMTTNWEGQRAYTATLRDITDRKEAQRMLQVAKQSADLANRVKGRFLANVSHELRTPLNAIIGFSELMLAERSGPLGSSRYKEYLLDIGKAGQDLSTLIDKLLDLSKIQAQGLELTRARATVRDILDRVLPAARDGAEQAGLTLECCSVEDRILLHCDVDRICQALEALISNSIKFTPHGGTVEITSRRLREGGLEFCIADTGIGMPQDQVLRAFTSFDRPSQPYAIKPGQGAGLGLALAKTLVELHGGTIGLDSRLGEGTEVRIRFPAECLVSGKWAGPEHHSHANDGQAVVHTLFKAS